MRALYISHNGMLEGLGRSQVLSYVRGLARTGIEFDLVSYELDAHEDDLASLRRELAADNIRYHPLRRVRGGTLGEKVRESAAGVGRALAAAVARRPTIVHGRSYLPTAVADVVATMLPKAKLLFDCRGMLGDEFVDAGYWTHERLEYRLLKRYERRAFRRAEGVVVLTEALRRWLTARDYFGPSTSIEAIPCCVDLEVFRHDPDGRSAIRSAEGFADDDLVLVYCGSLGSWYRELDIARFAGIVRERTSRAVRFLLLTNASPKELQGLLAQHGFDERSVVTKSVRPEQVPRYLSAADAGISFIKSCFSKTGSSPTKVAEYLACGLPVILNGDIGDQADLAKEEGACVVVSAFDDGALVAAADRLIALAEQPAQQRSDACRRVADARFGLERVGVARYARLYDAVARDGSRVKSVV